VRSADDDRLRGYNAGPLIRDGWRVRRPLPGPRRPQSRPVRIFLTLFILSVVLFAYPVWRLASWLDLPTVAKLIITTPLFLSQFIARWVLRNRTGSWAYVVRSAADFFLGLTPVILLQVLLAEAVLLLFDPPGQQVACFVLFTTLLAGIWGLKKAWRPDIVVVALSSKKLTRPVRFAQISDVHIGSRTSRFLASTIRLVNEQNPDFMCITGDFIDQPGVTLDKLRPLADFNGPVYYCIGNHERYEDLDRIVERLTALGVEVLRNRSVEVDGLQFIGIDDHGDPRQVARVLPFIDVKRELYSILLYHRPHGLADAHRHGIDLKISGHTHAGQVVPFHLAVNRVFEYARGLYQHGDTYLYVNEGTGTWGPTLRLGTRSEITLFELSPAVSGIQPAEQPEATHRA
jgi:predicted MPP superfamily phosphohydrolase